MGKLTINGHFQYEIPMFLAQKSAPADRDDRGQVFSCPGSRIDEDADVLAPRRGRWRV